MQKGGFSAKAFLKNLTEGLSTYPTGYLFKPAGGAASHNPEIVLYPLFKEKNKGNMKEFLHGATTLYYFWFAPNWFSLSSPIEEFDSYGRQHLYPVFFFSKFLDRSYFGMMTPNEITEIGNSSPCYHSEDDPKTEITFVNIGGVNLGFNIFCEDEGYNLSDLSFPMNNASVLGKLMASRERYFNFQPADALILKHLDTKELEVLMSSMIFRALLDYRIHINKTYFPSPANIIKGSHPTYGIPYLERCFGEIIENLAAVSQALPLYSIGNNDFRSFNQRSLVNYIIRQITDDLTDALGSPLLSLPLRAKWKNKLRL